MAMLMRYEFPGNIRELENIIERAFILCEAREVGLADLPSRVLGASERAGDGIPTVPTFENWRGYPPLIPHHPNGVHVDLVEYFASFERIEAAADFVLPGHDEAVFEREVYP